MAEKPPMTDQYDSTAEYAVKHNYDLVFDFEPSRGHGKSWEKLNITRDTIQKVLSGEKQYQWVWMLDYDTLIMNSAVKLEEVVEKALAFAKEEGKSRQAIQMILTRDCEPINAGSMIFRTTPWMLEMIEEWRAHEVIVDPAEGDRLEQGSLRDMVEKNVFSVAEKSVVVPQTWMNSYPEELTCYDPRDKALERPWKRGDFVIHFAGAAWHHKEMEDSIGTLMRKYHQLAE
ncbi:Putative glycosyltransferase 34, nucleotide-diphospho-sugar transferase [Septoria linicola]|uniref:Glycosyltransferase 34, nucleotide-diphospho-sugar transferase n=1 Tax=Septoria linicola TaxID=215465 RepID=A0A9Q9ATV6_9PEZI|nr:Putative glycosyltransferase 34, nucleotide-diphospho-sugar transferase [Septoria linicola]